MYNKFFSLLSGLIFGLGLTIAEMTNPAKIIAFLDITGKWDPSLIFVMIGAIVFSVPFFYFLPKKDKPFFSTSFQIPVNNEIDRRLLIGSSLFGIGWGMIGFCPGPVLVALVTGFPPVIVFFLSVAVGNIWIQYSGRPSTNSRNDETLLVRSTN